MPVSAFFQRRFAPDRTPVGEPKPFGVSLTAPSFGLIQELPGAVGRWNPACVLEIFCSQYSDLIAQLQHVKVITVERIDVRRWRFKNGAWVSQAGIVGGMEHKKDGQFEVFIPRDVDCAEAAQTLYHEVVHVRQGPMGRYFEEFEAYAKTESWAIYLGLPQRGHDLREEKDGREVPSAAKIDEKVRSQYGGPEPSAPGARIVGHTAKEALVLQPGASTPVPRPAVEGDVDMSEKPTTVAPKVLPPSVWVCPKSPQPKKSTP